MQEIDRANMMYIKKELVGYSKAKEILNKLSDGGTQSLFYLPDLVEVRTIYIKVDLSDGKRTYYLNKSGEYEKIRRQQLIDFMAMGEIFI